MLLPGYVKMPNKAMQLDNLRAVHLCAARCAPFVAHNRPSRKLRLMAALDLKPTKFRSSKKIDMICDDVFIFKVEDV